jgi:lysosomal alpha-mannosidase
MFANSVPRNSFVDERRSDQYNAPAKAQAFHEFIMEQRQHYTSNNIIITMGDDFRFMNAKEYFD